MKTIVPVPIWNNGKTAYATILNSSCIYDNLSTSANFQYFLLNDEQQVLTQGILTMVGQVYEDYMTNQYAWDWVASQLNLTIIGDVTTTTTSTSTTTQAPV